MLQLVLNGIIVQVVQERLLIILNTIISSLKKDTIIDHLSLRKIKRIYCSYNVDSTELSPYLIFQDSDTVSIFNSNEHGLYKFLVFNASLGDTIVLDFPYNNQSKPYRVIIDTIKYEEFDGVYLKKYVLNQLDEIRWYDGFYLEKVGGHEYFLPLGAIIIPESYNPIRCYHDVNTNINFTSVECSYRIINSTNDVLANNFELYPNPVKDIINIRSDIAIDNVEILNNNGAILLETKDSKIDISKLPSRVYFLKIYSKSNQTYTQNIIKK